MEQIIGWIALAALIAIGVMCVYVYGPDGRFQHVFGFRPSRHAPPGPLRNAGHARIRAVLSERAKEFQAACTAQETLQSSTISASPGDKKEWQKAYNQRRQRLQRAKQYVASCKEAFWRAAHLAQRHGFPPTQSYLDYLMPEPQATR